MPEPERPLTARIVRGAFDRWYLFHPHFSSFAWSGSRWVMATPDGLPAGAVQTCNFATETEARVYWDEQVRLYWAPERRRLEKP